VLHIVAQQPSSDRFQAFTSCDSLILDEILIVSREEDSNNMPESRELCKLFVMQQFLARAQGHLFERQIHAICSPVAGPLGIPNVNLARNHGPAPSSAATRRIAQSRVIEQSKLAFELVCSTIVVHMM
jgi:hypothetical protein